MLLSTTHQESQTSAHAIQQIHTLQDFNLKTLQLKVQKSRNMQMSTITMEISHNTISSLQNSLET
jgi:hypothetical protein